MGGPALSADAGDGRLVGCSAKALSKKSCRGQGIKQRRVREADTASSRVSYGMRGGVPQAHTSHQPARPAPPATAGSCCCSRSPARPGTRPRCRACEGARAQTQPYLIGWAFATRKRSQRTTERAGGCSRSPRGRSEGWREADRRRCLVGYRNGLRQACRICDQPRVS